MTTKINLQMLFLTSIICLLPLIHGLAVYDHLPDQVGVMHFLTDQESNHIYYAHKIWTAIGVPLFFFAINIIFKIITPQLSRIENSPKEIIALLDWLIPVCSLFTFPLALFVAMGIKIPVIKISIILVALVFIFLGNYLPKTRLNESYDLKILKKLNDPDIRSGYYRAGGYCFIIGGTIVLIASFLVNNDIALYILALSIPIFIMVISIPYYFHLCNRRGKI